MEMKWIPTAERLPEQSGDVIVSYVDDEGEPCGMMIVHYSAKHRKFNARDEHSPHAAFDGVTAWMPAPEPYREETK
ncbi:MAG: DUF551 domain-containing protein [Eubacteriales bacterium]|nr:DUF551 domain-containing protein [Eubacteriales bacterium]